MFGSSGPTSFSNSLNFPFSSSNVSNTNSNGPGGFTPPVNAFNTSHMANNAMSASNTFTSTSTFTPYNASTDNAANSVPSGVFHPNTRMSSKAIPPHIPGSTRPRPSKESFKPQYPKDSPISQDSYGRYYGPNVCRKCGNQFVNSEELKKHIKAEGHYDTPVSISGTQKQMNDNAQQKFSAEDHPKNIYRLRKR